MRATRQRAAILYKKAIHRLRAVDPRDLLFKLLPYRPIRVGRAEWEAQYAGNNWDGLKEIGELAHYSAIVGYCYYLNKSGTILDIGCGEGILQERLRSFNYSRYVGVDISAKAIRRASPGQDYRTSFVRADVIRYDPNQLFDIIIFNECLYYFENPSSVLKKYESSLEKDGLLIVSMHATERSNCIWRALEGSYVVQDETSVTNRSSISWTIKVLVPERSSYSGDTHLSQAESIAAAP